MSNVATRQDIRDAVRIMTLRAGLAALLVVAIAGALILAN